MDDLTLQLKTDDLTPRRLTGQFDTKTSRYLITWLRLRHWGLHSLVEGEQCSLSTTQELIFDWVQCRGRGGSKLKLSLKLIQTHRQTVLNSSDEC